MVHALSFKGTTDEMISEKYTALDNNNNNQLPCQFVLT